MPVGEWKATEDVKFVSSLAGRVTSFKKGTRFIIMDSNGIELKLRPKGTDKMIKMTLDEFHEKMKPNWRDCDFDVF